jgi:hypothetical protein
MRTKSTSSSSNTDFSGTVEGPTTPPEHGAHGVDGHPPDSEGGVHDGVENGNSAEEWAARDGGGGDEGHGHTGTFDSARLRSEIEGRALLGSARSYLDHGTLREALSYLIRHQGEGATIKDLKALVDHLGHGGVIERGFQHSLGQKIDHALQTLAQSHLSGKQIDEFKSQLSQLAHSRDPAQALAQFKELSSKLGSLAENARKHGLGDLSERLASLSDSAHGLAKFAEKARGFDGASLHDFATKFGKEVKDLRTLEDLKALADRHGVSGLLGHALDTDVGKHIEAFIKGAEHLPEARKKAEEFLETVRSLRGKSPEELIKHLKDLPGGLQEFAKLARSSGLGDVAEKLEGAVGRFKQVQSLAGDLKGLTPEKAAELASRRLKDIGSKDLVDGVLSQVPIGTTHKEGSFSAETAAYKRHDVIGSKDGNYYLEHDLELLSAGAKGRGSVTADWKHGKFAAEGEIEAHATLISARAQGHLRYGIVEAEGTASAEVGARAQARGSATFDLKERKVLVEGQAGAFAGAEANAQGKVDVGGVGLEGRAGVRAGVGVNIGGSFGYDKGKVTFGFNIGASLGIGFNLGFKISIDFGKIADTISKYVPGAAVVFKAATAAVGVITDGVKAVGSALASAGKAVKNFFSGW